MKKGASHIERAGRREARAVLRTGCAGRILVACMRDGLILHGDTQRAAPVSGFVCRTRLPTSASTLAHFGTCSGCVRDGALPRAFIPPFGMTIPPFAFTSV
jgi:hypothetical protein